MVRGLFDVGRNEFGRALIESWARDVRRAAEISSDVRSLVCLLPALALCCLKTAISKLVGRKHNRGCTQLSLAASPLADIEMIARHHTIPLHVYV